MSGDDLKSDSISEQRLFERSYGNIHLFEYSKIITSVQHKLIML